MLRWKTSSRSQGNGACVEVALESRWVKSSRSNANGSCVEVSHTPGALHIRDTKDRSGPMLSIDPTTWQGFVRGL